MPSADQQRATLPTVKTDRVGALYYVGRVLKKLSWQRVQSYRDRAFLVGWPAWAGPKLKWRRNP